MRLSRMVISRISLGVIVLLFAGVLFLPRVGQFIMAEDPFAYADTALILLGTRSIGRWLREIFIFRIFAATTSRRIETG